MKITLTQTEKLLKSRIKFTQFGFSMMLTRLKDVYQKNPSSLEDCKTEINFFLEKFSSIMSQDYETIKTL
ncbi:hypothetical protein AGMMS49975_18280 [Clostridia bacterium]|nr:hypothetical protein AGMMS49975_18280 [Clostridia bacterium]